MQALARCLFFYYTLSYLLRKMKRKSFVCERLMFIHVPFQTYSVVKMRSKLRGVLLIDPNKNNLM